MLEIYSKHPVIPFPQSVPVIVKPTTNPRIDRIAIDDSKGVVSVITGTEATRPTPPAITLGKLHIAQIYLTTATTQIVNEDIANEKTTGPSNSESETLNVDVGATANKIV